MATLSKRRIAFVALSKIMISILLLFDALPLFQEGHVYTGLLLGKGCSPLYTTAGLRSGGAVGVTIAAVPAYYCDTRESS